MKQVTRTRRRTTGEILGQSSVGEPPDSRNSQKCDDCGRWYKKNWMCPYWISHKPPQRGYRCMYCDMDVRGVSLKGGMIEMNAALYNACGGGSAAGV